MLESIVASPEKLGKLGTSALCHPQSIYEQKGAITLIRAQYKSVYNTNLEATVLGKSL